LQFKNDNRKNMSQFLVGYRQWML